MKTKRKVKIFYDVVSTIYSSKFSRFQIQNIWIRAEIGVKKVFHSADFRDSWFFETSTFFSEHPIYDGIFFAFFMVSLDRGLQIHIKKFQDFRNFFFVQPYLNLYLFVVNFFFAWNFWRKISSCWINFVNNLCGRKTSTGISICIVFLPFFRNASLENL